MMAFLWAMCPLGVLLLLAASGVLRAGIAGGLIGLVWALSTGALWMAILLGAWPPADLPVPGGAVFAAVMIVVALIGFAAGRLRGPKGDA